MNRFLDGLKHLPSTIAGVAVVVGGIVQTPQIQQLAALSPRVANAISTTGAVAAGLALIFGRFGQPAELK